MTTPPTDIYQRVTDAIVKAIEAGAAKYKMPWNTTRDCAFSPISVNTAKPYRGINTVVLWSESQSKGYTSGLWGTYKQWGELGGQVKAGEKAAPVCYWGSYTDSKPGADGGDSTEESGGRRLFCKGYSVFNLEQVSGVKLPEGPSMPHGERIARADAFFGGLPMSLKHGGNRAFYSPSLDSVTMPAFVQFPDPKQYYSVLAHETTHWTGAAGRLNRDTEGSRFGNPVYALEELVAELGAAYTMASLELDTTPREDHASYITSWLRALKNDKRAIFTAASAAQKAADFIRAESLKGPAAAVACGVAA